MALISCPECQKEISDKALCCPHCGCQVNTFTEFLKKNQHESEEQLSTPNKSEPQQTSNTGGLGPLIIIVAILVLVMILGGGIESDYERAGKEFGTWINKNPSTWTNTEKQYLDDLFEYMDKN